MRYNGVSVVHVETGIRYRSISEASQKLGIVAYRINGKGSFLPGYTFERVLVEEDTCLYTDLDISEEIFKSIPEYEGLYSISNRGRIRSDKFENRFKKITTNKAGQHVVVLSKNSIPKMFTVESLFNLTWFNKPIEKWEADGKSSKCRKVECVDESKIFESYKECCEFYRIDYTKFYKLRKTSVNGKFECKGHIFRLL